MEVLMIHWKMITDTQIDRRTVLLLVWMILLLHLPQTDCSSDQGDDLGVISNKRGDQLEDPYWTADIPTKPLAWLFMISIASRTINSS